MSIDRTHSGRPNEAWMRDLVFENPWPMVDAYCNTVGRHFFPKNPVYRYREFQTSTGPCDLLLAWERRLLVVEMKRDEITEDAITQCLRYMGDLYRRYGNVVVGCVCAPSISANAENIIHMLNAEFCHFFYFKFSHSYSLSDGIIGSQALPMDERIWEILYPEDEEDEAPKEDQSSPADPVEQAREIVAAQEVAQASPGGLLSAFIESFDRWGETESSEKDAAKEGEG